MNHMAPHTARTQQLLTELGLSGFLRSRRAAVSADDLELPSYGSRRVPGLRREELAELAGVSLTYYTRLEQGLATNPSSQVLDAIARALRLDQDERSHLHRLAGAEPDVRRSPEPPAASLTALLDRMPDVPAVMLSPVQDIIGWNRLGHALLAGHLDFSAPSRTPRPNKVEMIFTDAHSRSLHREWEYEATLAVASLRYVNGRRAEDPALTDLVGGLSLCSNDFARIWADQPVQLCTRGVKRFHHPVVGRLDLTFEVFHAPENDGHRLLVHYAEPGSTDDAALKLLASSTLTS